MGPRGPVPVFRSQVVCRSVWPTELLTTHDGRLCRCEDPLCNLLFHDVSRPGTRRGNKVNTKAYRTRQRSTEQ